MIAAQQSYFKIIQYLLLKNADLFLKCETDYNKVKKQYNIHTALSFAYQVADKKSSRENDTQAIHANACLNLFVKALASHLYAQGLKESNEQSFIIHVIDNVVGNFDYPSYYIKQNSKILKEKLEKEIQPKTLAACLKKEKIDAFCMGSVRKNQEITSIYRFFCNDGKRNLTKHIFSYIKTPLQNRR
jgi:hypothetical protein